MADQFFRAAGYLTVLIAPVLLALSAWLDKPYLLFGTVLLLYPLARVIFGPVGASASIDWDERIAWSLDRLPWVYVALLAGALAVLNARLSSTELTIAAGLGWTLSLWLTLVFATCVAHDLLHRPGRVDRTLGHLLAGLSGYPILGYEHSRHHRLPGNTAAAEWPRFDESVWRFATRRLRAILPETLGRRGLAMAGAPGSPIARNLRLAVATTLGTWSAFAFGAGWAGASVYASTIGLVGLSVQLVTYMQHWGLGNDNLDDARAREVAWDNDCRFQAWVTLSLSLHQAHHRNGTRVYYRVGLAPDSPRLPTGYVLLMFAAIVPPLWRRIMTPALSYWKAHPSAPLSAGRRVACIAIYR